MELLLLLDRAVPLQFSMAGVERPLDAMLSMSTRVLLILQTEVEHRKT